MSLKSLQKEWKTDDALSVEGHWSVIGHDSKGVPIEVKLARMEDYINSHYATVLSEEVSEVVRTLKDGVVSDDAMIEIQKRAFCKSIIRGFRNIRSEDGTEIPYTWQKALEFMDEMKDLYLVLMHRAKNRANFKIQEINQTVGNSNDTSDSSSPSDGMNLA